MEDSLHTSVPTSDLATQRLRLRPIRMNDAERLTLLAGDRSVSQTTINIPHPYPVDVAKLWIENTAELVAEGLLKQHAIITKHDSALIGCLTLRRRNTAEREAELSFWLGRSYWGQGYVQEAAKVALEDAARYWDLKSARAAAMSKNQRSIRVLEKLGFTQVGALENKKKMIELLTFSLEF